MSDNKKNKCRTCLKTNTTLKMLNSKPKMPKINKTYMDLLKYVTHLEVFIEDEYSVPQGICSKCCKRIRDAYMFIKQVQKCNSYFMHDNNKVANTVHAKIGTDCWLMEATKDNAGEQYELTKADITEKESTLNQSTLGQPKEELDSDSSSSAGMDEDNFEDLPFSMCADEKKLLARSVVKLFDDVEIKTEQTNYPEDLQPLCILTETTYDNEHNPNTISELDKFPSNDSNCDDPLDSEATDGAADREEKDVKNNNPEYDDKMLPVKCDECEKIFANSILLNRHKKDTHIPDELKIQCPKCPVKFSRRYNMYAHMRSFHETETVRAHQIQPRKLIKSAVCEHCNRGYSDKYKLRAHIKNKHGPGSPPKKEKQPPKRYLCTLCGLTCNSQSNLDIHYRRHTSEKPFKCDFCERAYARLYDVQIHRRIHTGETPFKCTVCEKAFRLSSKLTIHMRTHTNERPYKCIQCEKAFKQSKDLNIHKRTHTGERPYKCNVCHSTFTQSNSLKLHQTKAKHFVENSSSITTNSTSSNSIAATVDNFNNYCNTGTITHMLRNIY